MQNNMYASFVSFIFVLHDLFSLTTNTELVIYCITDEEVSALFVAHSFLTSSLDFLTIGRGKCGSVLWSSVPGGAPMAINISLRSGRLSPILKGATTMSTPALALRFRLLVLYDVAKE